MDVFNRILHSRGITEATKALFLSPQYEAGHDPFLLPDMSAAVNRLVKARQQDETITIYGDYDIDGLTATTVLLNALRQFGFRHVKTFIPNRFKEGYGLTVDAVERIARDGANLIITVDCGSLSEVEINRANERGVDVIVTDHHNVALKQPPAVAVINPKRLLQEYPNEYEDFLLKSTSTYVNQLYPFLDLPGVGVAFKLVQALQTKLSGINPGQEKWLLDLVALGTVCDVVTLVDENRTHVYWGLKVLAKTRRPGLRALMAVAGVRPETVSARDLGFALGPRMNAAGRLDTAQYALDMLTSDNAHDAMIYARKLDDMNQMRRAEQDTILEEAILQAEQFSDDNVLVVSSAGWNHGIVGIVAAKLLERYHKPTFVLSENGNETKGSARSYGDFSVADAIRNADDIITKGGGHKLAAGVTLPTHHVETFRRRVNQVYRDKDLHNQAEQLLPIADTDALLDEIDELLVDAIATLEPFGNGNPQPIVRTTGLIVFGARRMGNKGQHLKLTLNDTTKHSIDVIAFNAPEHFFVEPGVRVNIWYSPEINEWRGGRQVEGHLLHLERD